MGDPTGLAKSMGVRCTPNGGREENFRSCCAPYSVQRYPEEDGGHARREPGWVKGRLGGASRARGGRMGAVQCGKVGSSHRDVTERTRQRNLPGRPLALWVLEG